MSENCVDDEFRCSDYYGSRRCTLPMLHDCPCEYERPTAPTPAPADGETWKFWTDADAELIRELTAQNARLREELNELRETYARIETHELSVALSAAESELARLRGLDVDALAERIVASFILAPPDAKAHIASILRAALNGEVES